MIFDRKIEKLKLIERDASTKAEELHAQLIAVRKSVRAAAGKVTEATKSRTYNAHSLYTQHEDAGYTSLHASALFYLRCLDLDEYVAALRPFAEAKPGRAMIIVEHEAVTANMEKWTERGTKLYFEKELRAYEKDCVSFERWQAENPEQTGWREKPATRRQYFLMWRTAMARDIDYPKMIKRGAAHDWLIANGANVRLRPVASETNSMEENANG